MVEQIWGSLGMIVLFAVGAYLIIILVSSSLVGFQGGFESTICKFNAWMRAATLGNPLFESLISTSEFFTRGFSGQVISSMGLPLICNKAPILQPKPDNNPYSIGELVAKLTSEAVNCWDQFGLGNWDPLVMTQTGQSFTCYEQVIRISCTEDDLYSLWSTRTTELESIITPYFNQELLDFYMTTHSYSFAGFNKTYDDIMPDGMPVIGHDATLINCDGTPRSYYVSLYYIDRFIGGLSGAAAIPLLCESVVMSELKSDALYLCFFEYSGGV
ncbi:MAG: hypothetical protein WC307_03965 [Candidatus Nanoarchaeia archaeon]|jgi:hypothetical protein